MHSSQLPAHCARPTGSEPGSLPPLRPLGERHLRHAQSFAQLSRCGPSAPSVYPPLDGPSSSHRLAQFASTRDLRRTGAGDPRPPELGTTAHEPTLKRRSSSRRLDAGLGSSIPASPLSEGFPYSGHLHNSDSYRSSFGSSSLYPPSTPPAFTTLAHEGDFELRHASPPRFDNLPSSQSSRGLLPSPSFSGQLSSLHLGSPSEASAFSSELPRSQPSSLPLNYSVRSRHRDDASHPRGSSIMESRSQRLPYVLPLHPYGSDAFTNDELITGPPPPRHAFRRHGSESSLHSYIPPNSGGSLSQRSSTSPGQELDPFDPHPLHSFPSSNASSPTPLQNQGTERPLQRQRSMASMAPLGRNRRGQQTPSTLDLLIANSGMVDRLAGTTSAAGSSGGLDPVYPFSAANRNICDICGRAFGRPSGLIAHKKTHVGRVLLQHRARSQSG